MTNSNEGKISTKTILSQNYRNEYLFSEIYLQDIPKRPVTDENLRASLRTIKEWREYADKTSIEQWITSYISPVLDILGFGHQKNSKKRVNILILFPDISKTQSMSLCYVVSPGEDMDCTLKGKHWAEKIIRSLREHNFQWGILTDGFRWRIYHTKEPNPYETYVEVDLETILNAQEYSAFQIFYFFFRPENFITSKNGECKFDIYKEESTKTTEYIEENLRAAVEREEEGGEGVLQALCLGYLNALNQNTYSDEERIRIYGSAILYLFRLLFLFYSTARDLLRVESIQAFRSIVQDSYRFHKEGGAQSNSCDLWFRIQDLFAEIDLTYNGGLFNPHESNLTRFIEETRITDPFLSEVVFGLGYYQKSKGNFVPIEYRDLSVRHLGSLYEGLLEHKLFIAEENKVVRKSGNKVRYISVAKAGGISRTETIIEKGKIYFSEDAKERKLTGSYYTPEDVVEYIVKNTVDALLAEKRKELISEIKPILNDLESAINESERKRLKLFIDEKILEFIEEKILSLSVLDPAMGSGHFLVNATNHIANFIVELLNEYPGYNSKIDSNTAFWRRRVIENCIYGVDLNPLALELAKLCLWITAAFKEKPLSFLNHHLKQGNSLVGVSISDLEKFIEKSESKPSLFIQAYVDCIREAAEGYKESLSKLTEVREDIEEKKDILAELEKDLSPYKHLCNLFTHYLLGELKENDLLLQIENWKRKNKTENLPASLNSKNFFHWEIEFPDVFNGNNPGFDLVIGNPPYLGEKGHKEIFREIRRTPCGRKHYQGKMDIFYFFFHKSLDLLKEKGIVSFISTNYYITATGAYKLRKDFYNRATILNLINFNELKIFPSSLGQHNMITILKKGNFDMKTKNCITKRTGLANSNMLFSIFNWQDKLTDYFEVKQDDLYDTDEFYIRLQSVSSQSYTVLNKMRSLSIPLGIICNVNAGILTGADKVSKNHLNKYPELEKAGVKKGDGIFILKKSEIESLNLDSKEEKILKPWFKNSDIKVFLTNVKTKEYLIDFNYTSRPDIKKYPIIKEYLLKFKRILKDRSTTTGTLMSAFSKGYWWVIATSKQQNFNGPKIVVPQRSPENTFGYNEIPWYAGLDVYFITQKDKSVQLKYILALLNSRLYYLWLYFKGKRKGETLELYQKPLSEIPIKRISQSEQKPFIDIVDQILNITKDDDYLQNKTKQSKVREYEQEIDQKVYELYDLTLEEIKIVNEFKNEA